MDRINHQTWGTTETALAGTFGLAVVCFAFLYVFLIFGLHNEIVAVNRYVCYTLHTKLVALFCFSALAARLCMCVCVYVRA